MKHPSRTSRPLACLLITACPASSDDGSGEISSSSTSEPADTDSDSPKNTENHDPTTGSITTISETTDTTSTSDPIGSVDTSSESGDTSSESTGVTPSPACGDGQIDPGEQCDDAVLNSNTGACTLLCQKARCGDHLIWDGIEACDDGDSDNDDTLYDGCTTLCQFGPHCGDGVVQGPEECDLGEDNGGEFPPESVPCVDMCHFDAKIVFLSSATFKGGDIAVMGNGVEGADDKCQYLAGQSNFDNAINFKAWLSDANHSPAKDFTKNNKPYVRPDGVRIADNWYDLILNGPQHGISVTDSGQTLENANVWTGTSPGGQIKDDAATCEAWTDKSLDKTSHMGTSIAGKENWTVFDTSSCYVAHHLYCFEQ